MTLAIIGAAYVINAIILSIVFGKHLRYREKYGYNSTQEEALAFALK